MGAEQKVGTLFWEIEADTKKFETGAKKTEKQVKTLGQKFTGLGKLITGAFAVAAVAGIAKVSKELILAASDAEETRDKFTVVFASVADEAAAAAQRIQDEFKISDVTTQDFLSQVGDITSGLGATSTEALEAAEQITALGIDIAAFSNLSGGAEQSVKALTSLFTGEREAAKALGIVINDTNLKQYAEDTGAVFKELTPLEKGFLSLELAVEQSQLAIGNAALTQESFAGQSRIAKAAVLDLKVAMGDSLLPVANAMVSIFGDLTRTLADAVKEANNVNKALKDIADDTLDTEVPLKTLTDTLAKLTAEKIAGSALGYRRGLDDEIAKVTALISAYGIQDLFLIKNKESKDALTRATEDLARTEEERAQLALEEEAQRLIALNEYLSLVDEEYAQTEQGKIDLLQQQIDMWDEYAETAVNTLPQVQAILENLRQEMENLKDTGEETFSDLIGSDDEWTDAYTENLRVQQDADQALFDYRTELAAAEEVLNQQKLASAATLFGGLSELFAAAGVESRGLFIAQKAASAVTAGINSGVAFTKTLVDGGPYPLNLISAAGVLASGIAQQIKILGTPIPKFATGGDFVTSGPQQIMVGDNPGGRERVQITPIGSPNVNGPGSGSQTINIFLDKKKFFSAMADGTRTGQLVLTQR